MQAATARWRWALVALIIGLLLLPVQLVREDWCEEAPTFVGRLPARVCTDIPEAGWINDALLLAFTQMFMLVALASNWNLTGGFTGYVDFGHAVFFGLGAYATGIMMGTPKLDFWPAALTEWSAWPAMLVGAVVAAIFAVLIGAATLRLKGPYFSIAMLGTFVAMREFVRVARPLTGGGVGLNIPPYLNRPLFYYLTLLLALVIIGLMWWIRRSEFGASLIAIREDEVGAEMRGINTTLHKITAFWIAALLSGLVGGLWAYQNTFIDPDIVFVPTRNIDMVMMTVLGGLGTVAGPVIGVTVLYWLRQLVWSNFLLAHQIFEGVLLIVVVLVAPQGLMGLLGDRSGFSLKRLAQQWSPQARDEEQPA